MWLLLLCACVWMWWGGCGCGCTRVHVFALKRQICLKKEESRFSDKKKNKQTIVEETLLFGDPARVHKKKADRFLEIMYFCVYVRNSSCCVYIRVRCVCIHMHFGHEGRKVHEIEKMRGKSKNMHEKMRKIPERCVKYPKDA